MADQFLFEEKQYMGYNKYSILRRTVLALFCFVAYYWSENPKPVDVSVIHIGAYPVESIDHSGQLFFLMGIAILLISALLIFVLHIRTEVTESSIILDGLWTARKVKINIDSIVSVEKVRYGTYFLSRPVYNLHQNGTIRFYTSGNEAVELTDKEGLKYIIGSQKSQELVDVIRKRLEKLNGVSDNG